MFELDPMSALAGAGPIGIVAGWALYELRGVNRKLVELVENNTRALTMLVDLWRGPGK